MRILNRIVTVTENGLEYEADRRHAEILKRDMGIDESSKGVVTPGVRLKGGANWRSVGRRRESVAGSGSPRERLRPGPDGRAVRR